MKIKQRILKNIRILAIVALIAICVYLVTRVILFSFSEYTYIERFFGLLLLIGEAYILIHAFGYMLNILKTPIEREEEEEVMKKFDSKTAPSVAVVVAARHEPKYILEETFITLKNLNYPNKNIYLLDDSSEQKYKDEADELGERFGIKVFRREERHGAKAGIINDFVKNTSEKYMAVFDADQNPMPDFLQKTVSIIESDDEIGFVQTPQFYTNIDVSPIAKGAALQQSIFYENICEGKGANNAMFCCGTNVLFRKKALVDVGGLDEDSITEDFATSVKIHMKGYKSVYYNHVGVFGMAPESLPAYFKQQIRWCAGTIDVFRKLLRYFIRNPWKLSLMQWWEYFLAGSYYFIGWIFFFLMISPIAFLIFNIPSYFIRPEIYFFTFIPYYLLVVLLFYSTMADRHYTFGQIYYGSIMGFLSFPILMKAAVYGLLGKKMTFVVTTKGKAEAMSLWSLWPYFVMILLNLVALSFGLMRLMNEENPYPVAINMIWAVYHIFILSNIFYFNKTPKIENREE